ncbi:MAG: sigma-70 family RNA polymerase sigma factor [marine benthic group bacterium]|nr:sigma-70 family RNA polymerase sigma factor [Gemmatimonadota bacterium]MCL7966569.1 sigma-70 family RNA polymerase sigma factor [Gemmatimonadota bacterium]
MSEPWASLYREVWGDLVRYIDRRIWDPERAQELAQEVFIRALGEERTPDSPRAWLFTVAANLTRDEARRAIRGREKLRLVAADEGGGAPSPDEILTIQQTRDRVREALGSLNERERESLLMVEAGFSYAEIAEATGLSPGAVGTTLSRARRKLAVAYAELEGGEDVHAAH